MSVFASGCRSNKVTVAQARHAYSLGDLQSAESVLAELSEGPRRTRRESQLELAMVELAKGDSHSAIARLREARDHFDAFPGSVGVGDAVSLATDDNARRFRIAGYEQVMLRSLLAICSLAGDATDAEAYCLQAQKKQSELTGKTAPSQASTFTPIAIAPYLRGTLREATHQDYDDAERAFRLVSAIKPDFQPAGHDIERVASGSHSRPGHGVLYVIALTGNGPQLVETVAPTTTASLQIASTMLQRASDQDDEKEETPTLPTIASVKVPMVHVPESRTAAIGVSIGGQLLGATQTLTNVAELATARNEAEMPWTIARAVARRALKESSVRATSHSIGLEGNAAAAFEFAAINAWAATEHADTRCWGLLPREIQVLRAELPAGKQLVEFSPMSFDGSMISTPVPYPVSIEDGRNHYAIVIAPEQVTAVVP